RVVGPGTHGAGRGGRSRREVRRPGRFMMIERLTRHTVAAGVAVIVAACGDSVTEPAPPGPTPDVYTIPIVVHVIHDGEPIGEGPNLSVERIESQIRVLNEDFRRKPGTRGHNTHPDGGDARMEFVLARIAPDGSPTGGINRVAASTIPDPAPRS